MKSEADARTGRAICEAGSMSGLQSAPAKRPLDAQGFVEDLLANLPSGQFDSAPILYHVAALAAFRAAQRMTVMPPKIPEHVAADVAAAFRNVAYSSQIPEVRAGGRLFVRRRQRIGPAQRRLCRLAEIFWETVSVTEMEPA